MSDEVFIISGCRTAIGSFMGQFNNIPASELGTVVIAEVIQRAKLQPLDIEQVVMGQVLTAGQGQNTARQAAVGAKIPFTSNAYTINMMCGSGLKSVELAYLAIKNKDYNIVIAGGQENMTCAPHTTYLRNLKLGDVSSKDTITQDGLTCCFSNIHMGITAENLAKSHKIPREIQEQFAVKSQNKTELAMKNGYFSKEIVPVQDKKGKIYVKDEFPRSNSTMEQLAKLKPCFQKDGTVTPGTASGINDGAAAVLLCSSSIVKAKNLQPIAKIVAFAEHGVEPDVMGLGPVGAVLKVLKKAGWNKDDVDLYEINEAFAAQMVAVLQDLKLDESKVNVSGGAIALGHPLGASGTRILVTLLYNLERLNKTKGVASLCIGGGMGIAIAVQRC